MLLDIASYARQGVGRRDHFSPAQIAQISRTVRGAPEVVVKVLPKDSNSLSSINRHLGYIGRYGDLELETDDGERVSGKGIGGRLMADWDLDLDEHRGRSDLSASKGRKSPKLVHKLMLSMPPGTPPEAVLAAARNFLREEFALKHRYAFVLHTDERHPHVHAVVKAVSEQGVRLNIRKETLRRWRQDFARHMQQQGIEANATERAVRGESRTSKLDGIYRAARRGASTHMRERVDDVARDLQNGSIKVESGKSDLVRTRADVVRGWRGARDILLNMWRMELATQVDQFLKQMRSPQTEKESIAAALLHRVKAPLERSPNLPRGK